MKKHNGKRRGRMYLQKYVNWLIGYPVGRSADGIVWQAIPRVGAPYRVVVDSKQLHHTTRIWKKLQYRFPHALPKIVPNLSHWETAIPHLLTLLSDTLHHDKPLSRSLGQPTGDALHDALSWLTYLFPDARLAEWLAANTAALQIICQREGVLTALMVWELTRRDGVERTQPLLRIGTSAPVLMTEAASMLQHLQAMLERVAAGKSVKRVKTKERNPAPKIGEFANWLLAQRVPTRQAYLDLLCAILPADFYAEWEAWQRAFEQVVEEVRWVVRSGDRASAENLLTQLPKHPCLFHATGFFSRVTQGGYDLHWVKRALPSLNKLPVQQDGVLVCALFFDVTSNFVNVPNFAPLMTVWQKRMLTPPLIPHVTAWLVEHHNVTHYPFSQHLDALLHIYRREEWAVVFDLIERAAEQVVPLDTIALANLMRFGLIAREAGADAAIGCYQSLNLTKLHYHSPHVLHLTYLIARDRPFAPLLQRIEKFDLWELEKIATLRQFVQTVARLGWHDLLYRLLVDGHGATIWEIVVSRHLLAQIGELPPLDAPPVPAVYASWIGRYPVEFGRILATLAHLSPNAEATAQRILGKAFPQPAEIRAEIAILQQKAQAQPDNAKLQTRLVNLAARLEQPVTVSAKRRAKLLTKLENSLHQAVLQNWQAQTNAALRHFAEQTLGTAIAPEHFYQWDVMRILAALTKLAPQFRTLGIRLLQTPTTLLTEPANQTFIDTLQHKGIDLSVWRQPDPPRRMVSANGRTLHIGITTDPLDIFMMGDHFQTCLSVGSFNFFSTIANGVDVNKQVVYAWDEAGRVVGRCLLALSDVGGLLTFHPYCHDGGVQFGEIIGRFASDLAAQMNTVVIGRGNVSRLVAPDWYDDGTVVLTEGFAFLQAGSAFRRELGEISAEKLLDHLTHHFAPLPLNTLTLPMALHLSELQARPDLIVALIPLVRRLKGYTNETLFQLAIAAMMQQCDFAFIEQVVRERCRPFLRSTQDIDDDLEIQALRLITFVHPSEGLRLLHRSRWSRRMTDFDEYGERREIAAVAHEQLNRPKLAAQLRA